MSAQPSHVLFLCTGKAARSMMAEVMQHHLGQGRFIAYSAGSHPKGTVHPLALATMQRLGLPVDGLRSKSWEEFARPDAPALDMIVTVCDDAAGEVCPLWPGKPITTHWVVYTTAADNSLNPKTRYNVPLPPSSAGALPWYQSSFSTNSVSWRWGASS